MSTKYSNQHDGSPCTLFVLNDAAVVPVAHLHKVGLLFERVLGEGSVVKVLEDERPPRVPLDHLHRLRLAVRLLHLENTTDIGCNATVCGLIIRGNWNPGVRQCLGLCAADFWSSLAYESAEKTQSLPRPVASRSARVH